MERLRYENFVRSAFEFALGRPIERWGDPATLANTDYFEDFMLSRVKAAVTYSMEIFNADIRERQNLPEADYDMMDQILDAVIRAQNTATIDDLIQRYLTNIHRKYIQ